MFKKLNLLILVLFLIPSFFLISTNNADSTENGSNCCEAREKSCDYTREGELGQIAEYTCESYDYGYGVEAGCDDTSCENTVCQAKPSCCEDERKKSSCVYDREGELGQIAEYTCESYDYGYNGSGWDEECANLANELCEVCGGTPPEDRERDSDGDPFQLYSYFDLRDRESFVQVTNVSGSPVTIHVQIFDVNNNCNENNFFDVYTGADTHVYNMSDILRNDGNPSGVLLPADAYGMVVFTVVTGIGGSTDENSVLIGNFRILDIAGYEYRTNMLGIRSLDPPIISPDFYFNYNIKGNVTLSDVVGISLNQNTSGGEVDASPQNTWAEFDIDIFNTNEVPFSCRDIIFACIDDDSPLLQQLLEDVGGASVASFEYGINNAIPHSRGGELLCPGNNISDGVVVLRPESPNFDTFVGYIGLNSGNGRGSMDSFWNENFLNQDLSEILEILD